MRAPAILAAIGLGLQALVAPLPAVAQTQQLLDYRSIHHPVVGRDGMVSSQNETASRIGAQILARGGNAVDAAVATAFALAVVLPRAGNIGGDGFMLVHLAQGDRTVLIDYRSVAPKNARLEMFLGPDGKLVKEASLGYRAPGVPGTVAGLYYAQRKYGRLPWADVVQPAADLAEKGVRLSYDEAAVLKWGHERLQASEEGKRTFFKPDGGAYQGGEVLKQPDLAWSLKEIEAHGADAFYRGAIAQKLAADMKAHGGIITLEDLAAYRPVERQPLKGTYRGFTVMTAPPASSGGATLIEMLNILEHFDLKATGLGSAASLHILSETMKLGTADRYHFMGDTDFVKVPLAGLTSKTYAEDRAKLIDPAHVMPQSSLRPGEPWRHESPNTTHFSIVDADGNAVSNTFTLGADFGSGVMVDGAGFLLNNQMNNFSHAYAAKAIAAHQPLPPNAMQPGKRMESTMTPTMVFKDGKPWLITGSPGGSSIVGTVLQVIVDVVDYGLNIDEAVHQPRIFQGETNQLSLEPNFNPDTARLLAQMGHQLKAGDTQGSAQSIVVENGLMYGAADPRRPGSGAVPVDDLR
jgi:gamma-glutamyltranspeptidase/glutathione hydrolase